MRRFPMHRWIMIALLCGAFFGLLINVITSPTQLVRMIPADEGIYYPTVVSIQPKTGQHTTINAHPSMGIHPTATSHP